MNPRRNFPIPDGVVEVKDEYQLNLVHYELLHLKPRGTILFAGELKEIDFQFFAGENRDDGIFARLDGPLTSTARRLFDHIARYPGIDCFVTMTLLQFKLIFTASRVTVVQGSGAHKTLRFNFPARILKTHRRRYIRIPFNDTFPAVVRFHTEQGQMTRKLKDFSREGMRLKLEEGDQKIIVPGSRLRQAVLTVLNKEMPLGLSVVSIYPNLQAGLRIIAISEEDKNWIKDCIRVLMKQILNLQDAPFDDEIEKDDPANKAK